MILYWIIFAAIVLSVSSAVHLSTFFGVDLMTMLPGVMLIHVAIFPLFGAALIYAQRAAGKGKGAQGRVIKRAPQWLRTVSAIFFAYAFVNFGIFMFRTRGGGLEQRGGKYGVWNHGRLIRELTEQEYHRQWAYEVRGFSGHWMLFSSAALTFLVGARRMLADNEALAARPSLFSDPT